MTMRTIKYALLAVLTGIMAACSTRTVYSEFQPLPTGGWYADSVLSYHFSISDTTARYDVLLYERHTQQYPYQNMWLFLETEQGADTIEFYLADQRGRWLGNGFGRLREMPVLYAQGLQFAHQGDYVLRIRQGMREERLQGVSDIGVSIEKNRP